MRRATNTPPNAAAKRRQREKSPSPSPSPLPPPPPFPAVNYNTLQAAAAAAPPPPPVSPSLISALAEHFIQEILDLLEPAVRLAWPTVPFLDQEQFSNFARHVGHLVKMSPPKQVEILYHLNNYVRFDPLTFFQLHLEFKPDTTYPPGVSSALHIRHRNQPENNKYSLIVYPGLVFKEAWTTFDDYVERRRHHQPQVTLFNPDGSEKQTYGTNKSSAEPIFDFTIETYTTKEKQIETHFNPQDEQPIFQDRFHKGSGKVLSHQDFVTNEITFYNDHGDTISTSAALNLARKELKENPDAEVRKMAQEIIAQAQKVQAAQVQRIFDNVISRETPPSPPTGVHVKKIKETISNITKMSVSQLMENFVAMKILPAADPFEFVEAEYIAQNFFLSNPEDLLMLKQISKVLVFGTLKAILGAIKLCLDHYITHKRIAFLMWASSLVGLFQNEMVHYCGVSKMLYPRWQVSNQSAERAERPLILANFTKNKYQWVFFDMVSRTFKYMTFFDRPCKKFNANKIIKYSANSFNVFDMCYSQNGLPSANCALASLLEASYFQVFKGQCPADIFIGLQKETLSQQQQQQPPRKSLNSIVNSNNQHHYPLKGKQVTHFFTPKTKLNATTTATRNTALRYGESMEMCGPLTLNYAQNSAYIAQTVLYTEIHFFKISIVNTTSIYENNEQMYMMSHLHGLLFFWLRKLLEADKTGTMVYRDYIENIRRNDAAFKMTLPPEKVAQLFNTFFTSLGENFNVAFYPH